MTIGYDVYDKDLPAVTRVRMHDISGEIVGDFFLHHVFDNGYQLRGNGVTPIQVDTPYKIEVVRKTGRADMFEEIILTDYVMVKKDYIEAATMFFREKYAPSINGFTSFTLFFSKLSQVEKLASGLIREGQ